MTTQDHVIAWFERQTIRTPDSIALEFGTEKVTYQELNERANRLAFYLIQKKCHEQHIIGLCMERGSALISTVLAILKTGAAYLPIDSHYPADRIKYMIQVSGVSTILTDQTNFRTLPAEVPQLINLDDITSNLLKQPAQNPEIEINEEQLTYILFTSGSTGEPKGVAMPHRALTNLIRWQTGRSNVGPGKKTLQFSPISFDVSFWDIFTSLTTGATLVMIENELRLNPRRLLELMVNTGITHMEIPFVTLNYLAEAARNFAVGDLSLEEVYSTAEQMRITPAIREWFKKMPNCVLENQYGPTETHVITFYRLKEKDWDHWPDLPPIGKAIDNCEVIIQEDGALLLGGANLATGYLNRPELTRERFISHPGKENQRLYLSGDLGRLNKEGEIEYISRADHQVKIRGFRIEPGEVELALQKISGIREAAVTVFSDDMGSNRLVAYLIGDSGLNSDEIRKHLASQLPDYMIPSGFLFIDKMPLTPSGKLDKKSLPTPWRERPNLTTDFSPPKSKIAKTIAKIWEDLLLIKGVGLHDNFFDLGGNSLLSIECAAQLSEKGFDLPVVKLYQYPTIRGLEGFLSKEERVSPCDVIKLRGQKKSSASDNQALAIVGMSGRFPGASGVAKFWELICEGREGITFFNEEDLHFSIPDSLKNHPDYVKARGIIDDYSTFDTHFFGMSPIMAELMDPQQRKFLETSWEALEDAGIDPSENTGLIGVYAGVGNNSYYLNHVLKRPDKVELIGDFQTMVMNEKDYVATRTAFTYNLKGPAISLYSGCSTSLTAIAEACMHLRNHQCDTAIAGGASITCPVQSGYLYNEGGMLSADGHTRPFDSAAAGTSFNDGVGVVILKRLDDAIRDHNTIYSLIRGVGVSNDGSDKASFTAPSVEGQAATITLAQIDSGVDPGTVKYIETHGTATPLGDPVEIEALSMAYSKLLNNECFIGSVKSNIGHLTPASGAAGLIKTALVLKTKILPPTINHEQPNPKIQLHESKFRVNTQTIHLESNGEPLRAAISSFGVGGTNVHLILEEPPVEKFSNSSSNQLIDEKKPSPYIYLLSAKSAESLSKMPARLAQHFLTNPQVNPADIAYTLQKGRARFPHRFFAVAGYGEEAANIIESRENAFCGTGVKENDHPEIVFMFPGQGSQYVQMGKSLYEQEPVFREGFDRCCDILVPIMGEDIREVIFAESSDAAEAQLKNTFYTQPALFVIEYALAHLWMSWGIVPDALIGHSIGEFVAACLASVFSLEDGLLMVAKRAALMQSMPGGGMLSVRSTPEELEQFITDGVCLAAWNAPKLSVLSGPHDQLAVVAATLKRVGIPSSLLHTSHAFHSSMMDPVIPKFRKVVEGVKLSKPRIPFVSTVTGNWIPDALVMDHQFWTNHLRVPVRFSVGVKTLLNDENRFLLEVGPRNTLATLARQQASGIQVNRMASSLGKNADINREYGEILFAAGRLWLAGIELNWDKLYGDYKPRRVPLPHYPFQQTSYWIEPPLETHSISSESSITDLKLLPDQELQKSNAAETVPDRDKNSLLINLLIGILEESSGIEISSSEIQSHFLVLGLDSLLLTQIALTLSKKFETRISFRQLNEELSCIEKLTDYLLVHMPEEKQSELFGIGTPDPAVSRKSDDLSQPSEKDDVSIEAPPKPFGAIARIEVESDHGLSDKQDQYIRAFTVRYNKKTAASKEYTAKHRKHLADPRVVTGFKPTNKELTYQVVIERSHGSKMWDIDGNEYVDVLSGFGSNMFGNTPEFLVKALEKQLHQGYEIGPQHPLAGEVCQLISEMTGFDRAALCNTGSEAVLGALRMARTVTGRSLVVMFSGSYHGINDEVIVRGSKKLKSFPAAPGVPTNAVESTLVLDYGTDESLRIIHEHAEELAAVLVEPVQSRRPDFRPVDFLKKVRAITKKSGTALIFDEVITGFRSHPQGAQGLFGIKADIGTYGKVIGGGMPIGAMAGISRFMDSLDGGQWQFGDQSIPEIGVTYFAGTFVRHPLTLAAAKASLEYLKKGGGKIQEEINALTEFMATSINTICKENHWPMKIKWFASLFKIVFTSDIPHSGLLFPLMRYNGIHILEGFPNFLTTSHTQSEVEKIIAVFEKSAKEMDQTGFFDGYKIDSDLPDGARNLPITDAQKEIWLSLRMDDKASLAYNESLGVILTGTLDVALLKEAIGMMMNRHESLRSTISKDGENMIIHESVNPQIEFTDLSGITSSEKRELSVNDLLEADALKAFDLLSGPVFRTQIVKTNEEEHLLQMTGHHIFLDGWSFGIITQEIAQIYSALIKEKFPSLPDPVPFSQYAAKINEYKGSPENLKNQEFWVKQYEQDVPVMDLPVDFAYPKVKTFEGNRIDIDFDQELADRIREMGATYRSSFVNTLMALFELLLHKLTRQTSITLGLPASGQSDAGYYQLVGHCVNLLPLRCEINPEEPFNLFLQRRRDYFMDALEHQKFTFSNLLSLIRFERDPSRLPPLIPVVFNIDMGIDDGVDFAGLKHRIVSNPRKYENFELFLNVTGATDRITFEYSYNIAIFKPETIRRIASHFESLIRSVLENPEIPLAKISMLGQEERNRILQEWSGIKNVVPIEVNVWDCFERTTKNDASKPALLLKKERISYAELKSMAEQVAVQLIESGLKTGESVGIYTGGSVTQIIAILATVRAGGVYVPLDPEYPVERIRYILDDTGIQMILTNKTLEDKIIAPKSVQIITIDPADLIYLPSSPSALTSSPLPLLPSSPLYTMYTSGSTGQPKGVIVPHRAVVRLVKDTDFMQLDDQQIFVQLSNVSFDAATLEIWGSLLNGGALVMPDLHKPTLTDMAEIIDTFKPTVLWLTSGLFNVMVDNHPEVLKPVDQILTGGDVLSVSHVRKALKLLGSGHLINGYGPTENTTFSTTWRIDKDENIGRSVPIGRPIQNSTAYILDEYLEPVPTGIPGILYVGGEGLAIGYLNKNEQTTDRFINHPFVEDQKLYNTGDVARWLPDGNIEFIGRADNQVKVRGFRVEPGEIENLITTYPGVRSGVVIVADDPLGMKQLAGFVVWQTPEDANLQKLKAHLEETLPAFMVPAFMAESEDLPLTGRGKIDRMKLLAQIRTQMVEKSGLVTPMNDTEQFLCELWSRLLRLDKVGTENGFFNLGGHSLIAVAMMAEIEDKMGLRLPLSVLFEHNTIKKLAEVIRNGDNRASWRSLVPIKPLGKRPPLYIIHGAGLNVMLFNTLTQLLHPDQPVFGLQARGLDGKEPPLLTVEEMAAHYIGEIESHQKQGPYSIAGFSIGGFIAFEMAQQWKKRGVKVDFLGLFDTDSYTHLPYHLSPNASPLQKKIVGMYHRLRQSFFLAGLFLTDPVTTTKYKLKSLKRRQADAKWEREYEKVADGLEAMPEFMQDVKRATFHALRKYQMKPYDGDIDVYMARKKTYYMEDFKYYGWKRHINGEVRIHLIPGDHSHIFHPPNNEIFASEVQKMLDLHRNHD